MHNSAIMDNNAEFGISSAFEEAPKAKKKRRRKFPVKKVICYTLLVLYTVWLFFPMLTIFITSFTPAEQIVTSESFVWLPKFTIEPYKQIFTTDLYIDEVGMPGLLLGFINTMWMTLLPVIVGLFVSGVSAYAFSKIKFKGKEILFAIEIVIMVFPLGAFGVITQIFYYQLDWVPGVLPLIIPGLFGGIGTMFFLRMYMDGISDGLLEAAKMDGLGFWGIFFKIMFPLAKPAFKAQFIFGFVGGYNNYMTALLYLSGEPKFVTLSLYLGEITTLFNNKGDSNIHCAAAVMGMLPLIILYIIMQKYFIEGVAMGGEKE